MMAILACNTLLSRIRCGFTGHKGRAVSGECANYQRTFETPECRGLTPVGGNLSKYLIVRQETLSKVDHK